MTLRYLTQLTNNPHQPYNRQQDPLQPEPDICLHRHDLLLGLKVQAVPVGVGGVVAVVHHHPHTCITDWSLVEASSIYRGRGGG